MIATPQSADAVGLLDELRQLDVRLVATPGGILKLDAPQGTLTNDLLELVRQHKPQLLALLRSEAEPKLIRTGEVCSRCHRDRFVDIVLDHEPDNGQSVRLDCASCGRTLGFPLWYGEGKSNVR